MINDVVKSEKDELIVVIPSSQAPSFQTIPQFESTNRFRRDGIDPTVDHLERSSLLEKIVDSLKESKILVLCSPAASGKTSMLCCLRKKYPLYNCIYFSCFSKKFSLDELFLNRVTDYTNQTFDLSDGKPYVIILDDAQELYDDSEFWNKLIKHVQGSLPNNVRFIFSATRLYTGMQSSTPSFKYLHRLSRDDFLLNEQESMEFLNSSYGLPENMQFETLKDVIIKQCNGNIGALRISVDFIETKFQNEKCPKESELLRYFLSRSILGFYSRCFSRGCHLIRDEKLKTTLINCLLSDTLFIGREHVEEYSILAKYGILVLNEEEDRVFFSSTLAKRYFVDRVLPNRCETNPSTLDELVKKTIQNMSASALKQSIVNDEISPTFPHFNINSFLDY